MTTDSYINENKAATFEKGDKVEMFNCYGGWLEQSSETITSLLKPSSIAGVRERFIMEYREFSKKDEAWLDEFEKVMKKAPRNLFLFVGSGSLVVYSERRMDGSNGDGVNPNVPSRHINTKMICDGGDW